MKRIGREAHRQTQMEIIREGLFQKHPPGDADTRFADAIYALLREYCDNAYRAEWERLDDNERMYQGRHWTGGMEDDGRDMRLPKPTTPMITSTIENLKADLSDEYPEAVVKPDGVGNEVLARALTAVIAEELEGCDFEAEYDKLVHDVLVGGWGVWEVGSDPDANHGAGGTYIRHVVNKNWLCDPETPSVQDGRAVFKLERKPADWFLQHYPLHYPYMRGDSDLIDERHDDFGATTTPAERRYFRLIEAWLRVYDPERRRYRVHFVRLAGGQVLENSAEAEPDGYYGHGLYPFVVARLYPQKGSALGLGVTDLFKDAQRFSDKLDQIVMTNAFRASRPRIFVQDEMADIDDVRDFACEVIATKGAPSAVMQWQQPAPLPAYIVNYIQLIRESIKQESGSNDKSRGQTGGGVTAASAITALQEMSTKRSRMEARAIHSAFRKAVRLQIETLRDRMIDERQVAVSVGGKQLVVPFNRRLLRGAAERGVPVERCITVKTARQTKYTRMMHNELLLQAMQLLSGTVDPVIMLEGLEYDGLEPLLDKIRRAQQGGMLALQQQVQSLTELTKQQAERLAACTEALSQAEQMAAAGGQLPPDGEDGAALPDAMAAQQR